MLAERLHGYCTDDGASLLPVRTPVSSSAGSPLPSPALRLPPPVGTLRLEAKLPARGERHATTGAALVAATGAMGGMPDGHTARHSF